MLRRGWSLDIFTIILAFKLGVSKQEKSRMTPRFESQGGWEFPLTERGRISRELCGEDLDFSFGHIKL